MHPSSYLSGWKVLTCKVCHISVDNSLTLLEKISLSHPPVLSVCCKRLCHPSPPSTPPLWSSCSLVCIPWGKVRHLSLTFIFFCTVLICKLVFNRSCRCKAGCQTCPHLSNAKVWSFWTVPTWWPSHPIQDVVWLVVLVYKGNCNALFFGFFISWDLLLSSPLSYSPTPCSLLLSLWFTMIIVE